MINCFNGKDRLFWIFCCKQILHWMLKNANWMWKVNINLILCSEINKLCTAESTKNCPAESNFDFHLMKIDLEYQHFGLKVNFQAFQVNCNTCILKVDLETQICILYSWNLMGKLKILLWSQFSSLACLLQYFQL